MLRYRSFRNTDPPAYVAIWRSCAGKPGLVQPVSVDLFEQFVFGKLHFDYRGLIFALDDDRPVGFVHASFAPDADAHWISTATGVIALALVRPDCPEREVTAGLLTEAEAYLRERGAATIYAGQARPINPFYLGLYGGAEPSGILDSNAVLQEVLQARGYQMVQRIAICRQELGSFQAPIDRRLLQCRRRMLVQVIVDPPPRTRWEALTTGDFDLLRFELVPRGGGPVPAWLLAREMTLGDGSHSGRTAGVVEMEVAPEHRRQGLGACLLTETFRTLGGHGFTTVEIHAPEDHPAALPMLNKLGLQPSAHGTVFRKDMG